MSITGVPGEGPMRVGVPIADLTAGMYTAMGVLTALLEREVSGQGQWVHTSLLEAQIAMLDFQAARWTMKKEVPGQAGNNHPTSIPTGVFATSDGHINIATTGDSFADIWSWQVRAATAYDAGQDIVLQPNTSPPSSFVPLIGEYKRTFRKFRRSRT